MNKRYTLDQIKQKFIKYRELKCSQLTDNEYEFFCDALIILPREIVDSLVKDVDFVLLSGQQPRAVNSAFISWLDDEDLKNKKAQIVLTPIIFGFGIEWRKHGDDQRWAVLHEVAHFHLGHKSYKNQEDFKRKEEEANALVKKWIDDFMLSSKLPKKKEKKR